MLNKNFDHQLLIIGSGPAGITAAIYAKRAGVDCAIIEGGTPGGNLVVTQYIENYPGFDQIAGPDLAYKMYDQILKLGVKFYYSLVTQVEKIESIDDQIGYMVYMKNGKSLSARFVFIATGMKPKRPDISTLIAKENKGVSYCAICDGALYKDEETLIIGGGNSAVEESFFLLGISSKVHLVLRRDVFRADAEVVERLKTFPNVQIHYNSLVKEVLGDEHVNGVVIFDVHTKEETTLPFVKAVFPYIGQIPQTAFLANLGILDPDGFITVDEHCRTKLKNLYVIGDAAKKEFRQIVTAINDGGIAAKDIISKV